jgi:hypothetical protein
MRRLSHQAQANPARRGARPQTVQQDGLATQPGQADEMRGTQAGWQMLAKAWK